MSQAEIGVSQMQVSRLLGQILDRLRDRLGPTR
jgi:DNA-directed RNA polymerase specialized sigma subunit